MFNIHKSIFNLKPGEKKKQNKTIIKLLHLKFHCVKPKVLLSSLSFPNVHNYLRFALDIIA